MITEPAPRTKINRDNSRRRHRRPSHEGASEKGTLKEASNIRSGERTNGWKQRFIGSALVPFTQAEHSKMRFQSVVKGNSETLSIELPFLHRLYALVHLRFCNDHGLSRYTFFSRLESKTLSASFIISFTQNPFKRDTTLLKSILIYILPKF